MSFQSKKKKKKKEKSSRIKAGAEACREGLAGAAGSVMDERRRTPSRSCLACSNNTRSGMPFGQHAAAAQTSGSKRDRHTQACDCY